MNQNTYEKYYEILPQEITMFLRAIYHTDISTAIVNCILSNDDTGVTIEKLYEEIYISRCALENHLKTLYRCNVIYENDLKFYPSKLTYLLMETFVESALLDKVWEEI